jgi:hypothetical protein
MRMRYKCFFLYYSGLLRYLLSMADATSLGLRPKPQLLVRFCGEAAKTNQKNLVGRLRLPTPHPRVRGDGGGRCNSPDLLRNTLEGSGTLRYNGMHRLHCLVIVTMSLQQCKEVV